MKQAEVKHPVIKKYTIEDLCHIFGQDGKPASRMTIYRKEKKDPTFPKAINRYPLTWVADHIDKWIESHNRLAA